MRVTEPDYDGRQYRQMLHLIEAFEKGNVDLQKLIADLDALLECVRAPEQDWKVSFRKQWAVLEDSFAAASDAGFRAVPPEHRRLITDAIGNMRGLLTQVLPGG